MADPPWRFQAYSSKGLGKSPQRHYRCMRLAEIQALPVASLAAPDAALWLWATFPMLPQALETMQAWGFTYKSGGSWAKLSSTGRAWAFGGGYILRSTSELYLIGTRGRPRRRARTVRNLIVQPVREHSRKPDEARTDLEALYPGPRVELFARQATPGWTSWGNEVDKFAPELEQLEPFKLAAD